MNNVSEMTKILCRVSGERSLVATRLAAVAIGRRVSRYSLVVCLWLWPGSAGVQVCVCVVVAGVGWCTSVCVVVAGVGWCTSVCVWLWPGSAGVQVCVWLWPGSAGVQVCVWLWPGSAGVQVAGGRCQLYVGRHRYRLLAACRSRRISPR